MNRKISRNRFLKAAAGSAGAFALGGALPSLAVADEAIQHSRQGYASGPNTTGTYASVGTHHVVRTDHPDNVSWGALFHGDSEPVLTVESGDIVTLETLNGLGITPNQGRPTPTEYYAQLGVTKEEILDLDDQLMVYEEVPKSEGFHVLTGPVAVKGAEPGDWLEVRFLDIAPRLAYGVNIAGKDSGSLPGEYPTGGRERYTNLIRLDLERGLGLFPAGNGIVIPLKPFMGIFGVAPADPKLVDTSPPGSFGGNVDLKDFAAIGTTAFYPVQVPGALFYSGDGHAAQGDGEVNVTAIETSQSPTVQVILHKSELLNESVMPAMKNPWGETEEAWIAMGLNKDLNEAMKEAVRETIYFLNHTQGLTPDDAYSLASIGVDFEVSQVVDGTEGIHSKIYKHLFT